MKWLLHHVDYISMLKTSGSLCINKQLIDWLFQGLEDVVKDRLFSATKSIHLTADGEEENDGELPRKKSKES